MNQIGAIELLLPSARRVATYSCFDVCNACCTSGANCAAAAAVTANASMLQPRSVHMRHLPRGIAGEDGSQAVRRESTRRPGSSGQAELADGPCYVSPGDNLSTLPKNGSAIENHNHPSQTQNPRTKAQGRRGATRRRGPGGPRGGSRRGTRT